MMSDPANRILYVDDEPDVGVAFARAVGRLGYEADVAGSGEEAFRLARTRYYAVIVTDLRMPGLDGLTLVERLSPLTPSTAFVIVTGLPNVDLRSSRQADGAIASVMGKPWDDDELRSTLARAFQLNAQRKGHEATASGNGNGAPAPAILMVEDNDADADLLVALLAAEYPASSFTRVTRLKEAMERAHEASYEIILTDLTLPDARGFDAITRLQAAAPNTAIVVVSGVSDDSLAQQVVELGAQDYLVKGTLTSAMVQRTVRHARERKRAERRLMQLAHYDQLTGLANRGTFQERVTQALTRARRRGNHFAVMYIDVDRFKTINDAFGHDVGDVLLEQVGRRLHRSVRDYDTVARMGGDEFAVLADDLASSSEAEDVARRIMHSLEPAIDLGGRTVQVTCSIGVALYPDAALSIAELVKCADRALYQAKRRGRNRYAFYDVTTGEQALIRSALAADLNVALRRGEFGLQFQPQVSMEGYQLEAFELLLRWNRGDEVVSPSVFVPMLEEAGGMVAVGHWAIREATRRLAEWRGTAHPELRLAVNLSRAQVEEPGLADSVMAMLGELDIPPQALELLITEQILMRDSVRLHLALQELKHCGCRLTVKGFGAGFTSKEYLSRFGVDSLKVSRTFVSAAPDDEESAAIVRSIVALGNQLDIRVIADGVETMGQLDAAKAAGCHSAQGFLFGRPMPHWSLPATWSLVDDRSA
ncbi:MAG: EAL domain-containing protein [Gemmatimonadetes bacterium]|jgi:diguanylate cyclase (GGDEF)-like protein|nr:EAL domain-containing protein [Gemmatimonadota bacterium]MCC7322905.1 EAL domain-containing protein [Gemmatimonadaceae bacterium]MBK6843839.1 EAL domain-containing protein [Gemmatimonadota bacterium]MBK7831946.1 EAL domain-containing protein [Gemmatimonadota bacterium]MBK9411495.1 EAL domain-containing protein [Gemmatimonadota bacterium]